MAKFNVCPIGDLFKLCPSGTKAGFSLLGIAGCYWKNRQVGRKQTSDNDSYLCKGLT
ncbi:hypothetical protein [uncultured Gammaproteobacteria bacterium]|nr:hypothetical protein [uncultured Gammaproteobacteria bacterium]CAC9997165.1 hypothetical protein [uncultured Gammaproteobacteria bacterium]